MAQAWLRLENGTSIGKVTALARAWALERTGASGPNEGATETAERRS